MSVNLLPWPKAKFFITNTNYPLAGGKIYTYEAGTSTPLTTYSDPNGLFPNTNPVVLDANGEANIYLTIGTGYKIDVFDASNIHVNGYPVDQIYADDPLLRQDLASSADGNGVNLVNGAYRVITNIAALRGINKLYNSKVFVAGYYNPGDGGGGNYAYDAADTTSSDNGGTIIVASDGGRWKLQYTSAVSLKQFGAKADNTTDDTAAIQSCITWAAGQLIYAPAGQYRMNSGVTATTPISIYGDGNGCGPGPAAISNSHVTQFMLYGNFTAFSSTSLFPCIFRDFQINVAIANRPQASGGGISITGTGSGTNANSKIQNIGFSNVRLPISMLRPSQPEISGCYFDTWVTAAIYLETSTGIEGGGGHIHHNFFFGDTTAANSQGPCIFSRVGYLDIHDNLLLGSTYAVYCSIQNNSAGAIKIHDNWVEEQIITGFYFATLDHTSELNMLQIHNNEFSNISNITGFSGHIDILEDTTNNDWISDVQIHDNVYRSQLAAAAKYIWVQAAKKLKIHDETIDDLGANNPVGIQVSGATTSAGLIAPLNVFDCQITGTTNPYTFVTAAKTTLRDFNGIVFASLPANCADGSMVFCPDGTFANPVAGGGTGCFAKRLNNAWRGD